MGYDTSFQGQITITPPLPAEVVAKINAFADDRHDDNIFPGNYCQWVAREDGSEIAWDEGEKFYNYVEWMEYVIDNFIKPSGCVGNGVIQWEGKEQGDVGQIKIVDNVVTSVKGSIAYDDDMTRLRDAIAYIKTCPEIRLAQRRAEQVWDEVFSEK